MNWTDERVALLKKLAGEGHSAETIRRTMGFATRGAVTGKCGRMGIKLWGGGKGQKTKVSRPKAPPTPKKSPVEPVDRFAAALPAATPWPTPATLLTHTTKECVFIVDDVCFGGPRALDEFARRDGFADWLDLAAFWVAEHPGVDLFEGVLIRWQPLVPASELDIAGVAA